MKITSLAAALLLTGCATTDPSSQLSKIQGALDLAQEKNQQLESVVEQSKADLQRVSSLNRQLQVSSTTTNNSGSVNTLLPPNAKTGECYARILTPAVYRTETKDLLKKAADYRIRTTKPTYRWETERVLVKEASEIAQLVPARYEWRTETVLIKDAFEHLKTIPAVYETQSEKVLVKAAYTTWKKGRGPIEKMNNSTGEIMCLIEVPAEYKTVSAKVVVSSARTEKISYPATYKDIKKRVMVESPQMIKKVIPAQYKTIKVKKVDQVAKEQRIEIPAVYQTVTNRVKVSDSELEWRSILCETNTTGDVVRGIQRALLGAGHNPGPIDGVIGVETSRALKSYQRAKNLSVGQLTIETIKALGVRYQY